MRFPLLITLSVLTIALMAPEVQHFIADSEALKWPEVPATISALQFENSAKLKDPYFMPHIVYKYTVDGREFTGDRVSLGGPFLGYDMGVFEREHAVGRQVNVHVEPGRPEIAILEPKPDLVLVFSRLIAAAMFFSLIYISTYPPVLNRSAPSTLCD